MRQHPMTVCVYAPAPSGGHARYAHELLSALARIGPSGGVDVSLVTSERLSAQFRTDHYPIHAILPAPAERTDSPHRLRRHLDLLRHTSSVGERFFAFIDAAPPYEIVHLQEYAPWLAPSHFRRLRARGKRLYATVHNITPHGLPPGVPSPLANAWQRAAWRGCHGLIVHTPGLRDRLAAFLGPGHPPIFVAPHGIWQSASATDVDPSPPEAAAKSLLFFGTIRPNKGLHNLLRALRRLPDVRLTVAGACREPRYAAHIRCLVAALPPGQVTLLDRFVDDADVPALFAAASLVVLPYASSFAAQSGVLHDALAYRRPVVVTDVGALGESVRSWGVGGVVPPENDAALTDAIRALLTPARHAAAVAAIDGLRDRLSWARAAELTLAAYRSTS